jgi:hypothetical protein
MVDFQEIMEGLTQHLYFIIIRGLCPYLHHRLNIKDYQ